MSPLPWDWGARLWPQTQDVLHDTYVLHDPAPVDMMACCTVTQHVSKTTENNMVIHESVCAVHYGETGGLDA